MVKRDGQIPCIFRGPFIREQVDPRVKEAWGERPVPWGDLRRTWKIVHCRRINPTGYPEDCPYPEEDCALAFMKVAIMDEVTRAERPGAMFRALALARGIDRADNKPLARDRVREGRSRYLGSQPDPPWDPFPEVAQDEDEAALSRRAARPSSLGEVLGSLDLGARQVRSEDGEEGVG